jgi:hypothetical protein
MSLLGILAGIAASGGFVGDERGYSPPREKQTQEEIMAAVAKAEDKRARRAEKQKALASRLAARATTSEAK